MAARSEVVCSEVGIEFYQYGRWGIPFKIKDHKKSREARRRNRAGDYEDANRLRSELYERAYPLLVEKYGEFFTDGFIGAERFPTTGAS